MTADAMELVNFRLVATGVRGDSTIVRPPGCTAAVDGGGNLLITLRD